MREGRTINALFNVMEERVKKFESPEGPSEKKIPIGLPEEKEKKPDGETEEELPPEYEEGGESGED